MKKINSCQHATELMSLKLDKQLKTEQHLWLTAHLMMCRHCRECQRQLQLLEEVCSIRRKLMDDPEL